MEKRKRTKKWVGLSAGLTLFAAYCVLMTVFLGSACPLFLTAGYPCPACGMTRAVLLALRGNFAAAFSMHPLFPFAPAALVLSAAAALKPALAKSRGFTAVCLIMAAGLIAVYIYRMATAYPSSEPMIYNENCLWERLKELFA